MDPLQQLDPLERVATLVGPAFRTTLRQQMSEHASDKARPKGSVTDNQKINVEAHTQNIYDKKQSTMHVMPSSNTHNTNQRVHSNPILSSDNLQHSNRIYIYIYIFIYVYIILYIYMYI